MGTPASRADSGGSCRVPRAETTTRAYDGVDVSSGHAATSGTRLGVVATADWLPAAAAVAVVAGALGGERLGGRTAVPHVLAVFAATALLASGIGARRRARVAHRASVARVTTVVLVIGVLAMLRADAEWRAVSTPPVGPYSGWALVAADPVPRGASASVVLGLDGRRFEAWVYGHLRRRVEYLEAGDWVWVSGARTRFGEDTVRRRAAVRHVVGRVRLDIVADVRGGTALATAANRVRAALRDAAARSMTPRDAALFTGLVIGDDARQDRTMVEEFRDAGLSHLTAVSGQNVAFVLLAASPLLGRLPPVGRWAATLGVVAAFVVVARAEPSVLRAAVMAALSATAFAVGRPVRPMRLLFLAVTGLVLIDPFLVRSVGFWLSAGATAGVCAVSPAVERRLPGPRWLAVPLALTLGAQAGVAIPSLLVFGRLPLAAIVANPLAGPVAGAVMLAGMPSAAASGLLAASGSGWLAGAAMWPVGLGTRWVAQVAQVVAVLDPPTAVSVAGWGVVGLWVALRRTRTPVPI